MFFSGGLFATYFLYKQLKLLNNFLVFILPGACDVWFILMLMNFFRGIPPALEEAACAFIRMKNGATIMLETSWALNTAEPVQEGSCVLCGSKEGLQIKNNVLKVNKIEYDRQTETVVNTSAGGVAFYAGAKASSADVEAANWIKSIVDDTAPVVLPEQALVVSEILEAIYESSKTGKPVYFN